MMDYELAADLCAIFAADPALAGALFLPVGLGLADLCQVAQADVDYRRPAFLFVVRTRPLDASGHALAFRCLIDVQTDAAERDPFNPHHRVASARHAARVSAIARKLFGTGALDFAGARTALTAALAARGRFTLLGYDAGIQEDDPQVTSTQFETPVQFAGVVKLAPPTFDDSSITFDNTSVTF